ncbi:Rpn family recombination-promoting nuclease/putative transposase [Pedobacter sp. SAFR-022]|uniref:Rpn family recombination-promoting nuclease/putative transposase n=1 Tax=Pedobacter sp. SAFR-022 TaxID=3436861 RepID=UPI003F7ED198
MSKPPVPRVGKYIDPLVDFAFKKIFGTEPNKDLLIAFLNAVFRGRKHIIDLVFNKIEHPGDLKHEGSAIFDLLCTGENGEQILIEVQRARQTRFKERALFYASRLISEQAPKGDRAAWGYNISEVYLIALLENFGLEDVPSLQYLHDICLCNRDTGEVFYNKLGYTYIELSKFDKTEDSLETDLEKWFYVLKNMSKMHKIPVYFRKPIFEKLFEIAEYSNLTKEEKTMYDQSLKYKWDNESVLEYAVSTAKELGMAEGLAEGEHKKALDIALKMKKEGFPIDQIAKFTDLSTEEIEQL